MDYECTMPPGTDTYEGWAWVGESETVSRCTRSQARKIDLVGWAEGKELV